MKCSECNNKIADGSTFCNHCGSKIEDQGKTCPNSECRKKGLPLEALFCPDCGTELEIQKKKKVETYVEETPTEKIFVQPDKAIKDEIKVKSDTLAQANEDSGSVAIKVVLIIIVVVVAIAVSVANPALGLACAVGGSLIGKMIWKNL